MLKSARTPHIALLVMGALGVAFALAAVRTNADELAKERVIRGTVVDADGKPVADAEVVCTPDIPDRFPDHSVRSGGDGTFTMTVPPADEFETIPDALWCVASGYRMAFCPIPKSREEQSSIRLVLARPNQFSVKVLQPDGKPAQNAVVSVPRVVLIHGKGGAIKAYTPDALVARTTVTTDAQGVALLPAWAQRDIAAVDVVTPSLGRQTYYPRGAENRRRDQWEIKLLPAGKLKGRVVAEGLYPVDGLTLRVFTQEDRTWHETSCSPIVSVTTVTTDTHGCFEIPATIYGWAKIIVINGDNKPYQHAAHLIYEFRPGDAEELVVRLDKASHCRGVLQLTDPHRKPSQFRVVYTPPKTYHDDHYFGPAAQTGCFLVDIDDTGKFDFYSLPGEGLIFARTRREPELDQFPGWVSTFGGIESHSYWLAEKGKCWARRDTREEQTLNYLPKWRVVVPPGGEDVECPPIELIWSQGRVLDEEGRGLPNIRFRTLDSSFEGATDDQGRYSIWLVVKHKEPGYLSPKHAFHFCWDSHNAEYAFEWDAKQLQEAGIIPDVVLTKDGGGKCIRLLCGRRKNQVGP